MKAMGLKTQKHTAVLDNVDLKTQIMFKSSKTIHDLPPSHPKICVLLSQYSQKIVHSANQPAIGEPFSDFFTRPFEQRES